MLLKQIERYWLHMVILFLCNFYSYSVYATCSGLGCSCSVATTAVTFGTYVPTTLKTSNGNVAVTCSALVLFTASYVISMAKGNSTTYTPRFMNLLGVHLNYNLYTTAGFASICGDGTGGTVTISDSYTAVVIGPVTRNYTVFGRIPASQFVNTGTYTDAVLVSVTY